LPFSLLLLFVFYLSYLNYNTLSESCPGYGWTSKRKGKLLDFFTLTQVGKTQFFYPLFLEISGFKVLRQNGLEFLRLYLYDCGDMTKERRPLTESGVEPVLRSSIFFLKEKAIEFQKRTRRHPSFPLSGI
jgi:hypothetical protein